MRGKRAACLIAFSLALMALPLQAQDAPVDNWKESNMNPKPEPPTQWPERSAPLRIGLSAALGIPHLIGGALEIMWGRALSFSIGAGHISVGGDDGRIDISHKEALVRIFPWSGNFFIGVAGGVQTFVGTLDIDGDDEVSQLRLETETRYVTPQIGWLKRWDFGLMMGFDIGYQTPVGSKSTVEYPTDPALEQDVSYQKDREDLEKTAKALGKKAYPSFTLFRIGWLF